MEPADSDRRLNRAFERLPVPHAPATLVPRVMRLVAARERAPWYRREWRSWPIGWQIVSVGAGLALLVLALTIGPSSVPVGSDALAPAQAVSTQVEPTVAALQILWRVVIEPLVPMAFVLVMVMGVACVVIGLALNYLVQGRTWQR